MGKTEYDILMREMDAISDKVSRFPRYMQETVYWNLVNTLLDSQTQSEIARSIGIRSGSPRRVPPRAQNISSIELDKKRIRSYYREYELEKTNDMQFAAACAHYLSELASEGIRRNTIDETLLIELCEVVGREPPGNARSTLNNARRLRGYFEVVASGQYALAEDGRKYVQGLLNKESAS